MTTNTTIGEFSPMTRLTIKTLQHYHRVRLLEPSAVDARTGYRYYSTDQVPAAQMIRRFRDLEMPIEEVRGVLSAPTHAAGHGVPSGPGGLRSRRWYLRQRTVRR